MICIKMLKHFYSKNKFEIFLRVNLQSKISDFFGTILKLNFKIVSKIKMITIF